MGRERSVPYRALMGLSPSVYSGAEEGGVLDQVDDAKHRAESLAQRGHPVKGSHNFCKLCVIDIIINITIEVNCARNIRHRQGGKADCFFWLERFISASSIICFPFYFRN